MDKVDGPYYLFPAIKVLRDALPAWLPLVGIDLGDTNVVPVDYVAAAIDHLAHLEGRDGEAFHLVNPEPQPVVDMLNAFCGSGGGAAVRDPARPQLPAAASSGSSPPRCGRYGSPPAWSGPDPCR